MAAATALTVVAVAGISMSARLRTPCAGGCRVLPRPRHAAVVCWTGETSATVEIRGVPISVLYDGYADLTRMTEWSPLLHSVTVDSHVPSHSVWVMRIPRALKAAARTLGYPETVSWEADLVAPGPPSMNWTSTLDETGRLKGLPDAGARWPRPSRGCHAAHTADGAAFAPWCTGTARGVASLPPWHNASGALPSRTLHLSMAAPALLAGFEPAGSVSFRDVGEGTAEMTITLRYTLPDPVEW